MSTSALARYSTVAKPWLKVAAFSIFADQRLRDRLAGLVVQREAVQHLGRRQPVLEELRRELDVVARHVACPTSDG